MARATYNPHDISATGDPRHLKKAQLEKEQEIRLHFKRDLQEKDTVAKDWLVGMQQRVAQRPYLFEQASVNAAVERAKQEVHYKFEAALRKAGLAERLDLAAP